MRAQRGLSLVELLVSVTILALATTVALVIYDQARLAFKHGENVTEQQQVVRIAFDIVTSDIRMAGFNTNPDGNKTRPDEQIEFAGPTAITVRADFDGEDPVDSELPEATLGGSGAAYLAISTGNDEIFTYVLGKEDGASTDTLSFGADVGDAVRDGSIETVAVGGVDLAQTDPPYTLYRLVLENDPAGCCGDSFVRRVPIVDNVRHLRFRYFDRTGAELTPPGGAETDAARAARASIRRVHVDIEALTRDSDPHWLDADDPDPDTRRFHKFRLDGDVTPPNLGRSAIRDLRADATPPSTPGPPTLYPGHCGGLWVTWPPNPPQDEVAYYEVDYGTDPVLLGGMRTSNLPGLFLSGLADGVLHYATVRAIDIAGNRSAPSTPGQETTVNFTTPEAVTALAAADGTGRVDLTWLEAARNVEATPGDPASPVIRDLAGYRVYRSSSTGFTPSAANLIADETTVAALPSPAHVDFAAPACVPQYYRVAAVDTCGTEGQASVEEPGLSSTDVDPIAPLDVHAFRAASDQVRVVWSPVRENAAGAPIVADRYELYRSPFQPFNIDDPASWSYLSTVVGATEYVDPIVIPDGQTVFYLVRAVDSCSPPNQSSLSEPANPICNFSGRVQIVDPPYGATVWSDTDVLVQVVGAMPTVNNDRTSLTFLRESNGSTWSVNIGSGGFSWQWLWDADPGGYPTDFFQAGSYLVTAEVEQRIGTQICSHAETIRVHLQP